ncbi:hypothetical protein Golob_008773 [Gossypium lobatum]|uniref:RNase H type-1 domain-containing protein n=2 Tax=Gossypium TaxID=3633 RepID=A0A7J8XS08_GOSAI|nr:hypothetical protein [Gossypium lobatum]MBA0689624.1 hypothetical protein [Gossypium aridum]
MPPIESFIRVNFDVGFLYGLVRRVLGLSSEISAASDGVVGVACFWKSHVPTPLEVEAWACLEVIRFAMEIGFRRVEFEGWSRHHPRCGARRVVTCWMGDFSTIMMVEGTDTLDLGDWQRHD